MRYIPRKNLSIIKLKEARDFLTLEEILLALKLRPACTIYVDVKGKLHGIVNTYNIMRGYADANRHVLINQHYKFEYSGTGIYWKARKLLHTQPVQFRDLPLVNKSGILAGVYTSRDDLLSLEWIFRLFRCRYAHSVWSKKAKIALVVPNVDAKEKTKVINDVYCQLSILCSYVELVDRRILFEVADTYDLIICADQDEKEGITTLLQIHNDWAPCRVSQFIKIGDLPNLFRSEIIAEGIAWLRDQRISFVMMGIDENNPVYAPPLSTIRDYYLDALANCPTEKRTGTTFLSNIASDFYADIYSKEYVESIRSIKASMITIDMKIYMKDVSQPLYHVRNRMRVTCGQKPCPENEIVLFGPCTILGRLVDDSRTISSLLQRRLNHEGVKYNVKNMGQIVCRSVLVDWNKIINTSFSAGDIIVWLNSYPVRPEPPDINLVDILLKNNIPITSFLDNIFHCNHKMNAAIADEIYEFLFNESMYKESMLTTSGLGVLENPGNLFSWYLNSYFYDFDPTQYETVGAIVMNCNPFTYGHRYLIEYSSKKVDYLIIFVVEEDLSVFSFAERFTMVKRGVEDISNVRVVPSGDVILSQTTFPQYFAKVEDEDLVQSTENDITVFAREIAPKLNIKIRFVGEEPEDMVTNAYNDAMKRILPEYGIELMEIPRIQRGGATISASRVRKYLESGDIESLKSLVPEITQKILFSKEK